RNQEKSPPDCQACAMRIIRAPQQNADKAARQEAADHSQNGRFDAAPETRLHSGDQWNREACTCDGENDEQSIYVEDPFNHLTNSLQRLASAASSKSGRAFKKRTGLLPGTWKTVWPHLRYSLRGSCKNPAIQTSA